MAFAITIAISPIVQEFTLELFPFRIALEAGRFCLYSSGGWDHSRDTGRSWLTVDKHATGKGYDLFLGSRLVSVGITPSAKEQKEELEALLQAL